MRDLILAVAGAAVAASLYFLAANQPSRGRLWAIVAIAAFLLVAVNEVLTRIRHRREFSRRWSKLTEEEQLRVCRLLEQDGPQSDGDLCHILGIAPDNVITAVYKRTRLLIKHDYQGTFEVDEEWKSDVRRRAKKHRR